MTSGGHSGDVILYKNTHLIIFKIKIPSNSKSILRKNGTQMQNTQRNNEVLTFDRCMVWFDFVFKVYSEYRGTDIVRRERIIVLTPYSENGIKSPIGHAVTKVR